ncbi:MAG: hypothetical protein HGA19_19275, partial [Oscillochloris sp.]|nr:hypothetical protein [Oscillochloris sp.]
ALLRDSVSDAALLTGSSIAGALRSYLRSYERGYRADEPEERNFDLKSLAELLFGGRKGDDEGFQSPLIIADALSETPPQVELRDGVRINSATRTPDAQGKYDLELLPAGTRFPLCFELALTELPSSKLDRDPMSQAAYERSLREALLIALQGLESGLIGIGMKKRRGFGCCAATEWKVWEFDMSDPSDMVAWLAFGRDYGDSYHREAGNLATLIGTDSVRKSVVKVTRLEATFALEGSILIRAGQDEADYGPDVRHLHARQADGTSMPVISGTALAGVLRHQAERIANTLVAGSGPFFTRRLFGCIGQSVRRNNDPCQASRLVIHESVIEYARTDLVQSRVSIDRFTGGALDGALFSEQPAFGLPETRVTLRLDLYEPEAGEIGMLLLLLKDLWTGELPVGGERSIGRGRLHGLRAELREGDATVASFMADGCNVRLVEGDGDALNTLVTMLPIALASRLKEDSNGAS